MTKKDAKSQEAALPGFKNPSFHCPHCGTYAHQRWRYLYHSTHTTLSAAPYDVWASECVRCDKASLWVDKQLSFPDFGGAMSPNADMPEDVKQDYLEAASVMQKSPRAAAALLRLAMEKLCQKMSVKNGNAAAGKKSLQENMDDLKSKRLIDDRLLKAMDAVRVIGNEAVHPGVLDLDDDVKTVGTLFGLVNFVVDELITKPAAIDAFYDNAVPDSKKRKDLQPESGAGDSGK